MSRPLSKSFTDQVRPLLLLRASMLFLSPVDLRITESLFVVAARLDVALVIHFRTPKSRTRRSIERLLCAGASRARHDLTGVFGQSQAGARSSSVSGLEIVKPTHKHHTVKIAGSFREFYGTVCAHHGARPLPALSAAPPIHLRSLPTWTRKATADRPRLLLHGRCRASSDVQARRRDRAGLGRVTSRSTCALARE